MNMKAVSRLLAGLTVLLPLHARAGEIQLVSRAHPAVLSETPGGRTWLPDSFSRIASRDGRFVAFLSFATNLVLGVEDTNGSADLFLRDRETQTTVLVSHAAGFPLRAADASVFAPSSVVVSANGRFVAYSSDAPNLAGGQTRGATDIFLFDRVTSTTTLVTHAAAPPTGVAIYSSFARALSDDGRYLVFMSNATLIPGQVTAFGVSGLFLFDRLSGAIVLVSHPFGSPATGVAADATAGSLSEDGQRLVFTSDAPSLVPGQVGSGNQVFLYEAQNDHLTLLSHGPVSPSSAANGVSQDARISGDGTQVSFSSSARDLVPGFTSGEPLRWNLNVYLYSIASNSSRLVSHAASSPQVGGEEASNSAEVSRDGRIVTFLSGASNLAGFVGVNAYVWNGVNGEVSLVSRSPSGQGAGAGAISLSSDGYWILFSSYGLLVPGQVNLDPSPLLSTFLMDLRSGHITLAAHPASSPLMSRGARATLSGDGQTVVLESSAVDLVEALDFNAREDIFAYDVPSGTTSLVSRVAQPSRSAMGDSGAASDPIRPLMSRDGRYVAFAGNALNLFPGEIGQADRIWDLFQADRFTGKIGLVTHAVGDALRAMGSRPAAVSISTDGRYIVYASEALLAPGATSNYPTHCYIWDRTTGANALIADDCGYEGVAQTPDGRFLAYASGSQIYLLDRAAGLTQLVSRQAGQSGTAGNGISSAPTISYDGRWTAFYTTATDLVTPGTAGTQVFLFDALGGTNTLVSHIANNPAQGGNAFSYREALAADGSGIAYVSSATDLVPGQVDQQATDDVFLYDCSTGLNRLVSHSASSLVTATGVTGYDIVRPAASENGRFVAFNSFASNLVPGQSDTNPPSPDDFLYDRTTEANVLVSHSWISQTACVGADPVAGLSSDGSKVLFTSPAGNVVAGQVNRGPSSPVNAFLFEAPTGGVSLLSGMGGSPVLTGNGRSFGLSLTPDASVALLSSDASDLVPDDFNWSSDVFVNVTAIPPAAGGRSFHTVSPCRLADTRLTPGDWGGPAVSAGFDRSFVGVGRCGIPVTAVALSLNVTVTGPTAPGDLRLFAGGAAPLASIINFTAGQTRANSAVAYLGRSGELTVRNDQPYGQVHVILDVNGYLE